MHFQQPGDVKHTLREFTLDTDRPIQAFDIPPLALIVDVAYSIWSDKVQLFALCPDGETVKPRRIEQFQPGDAVKDTSRRRRYIGTTVDEATARLWFEVME